MLRNFLWVAIFFCGMGVSFAQGWVKVLPYDSENYPVLDGSEYKGRHKNYDVYLPYDTIHNGLISVVLDSVSFFGENCNLHFYTLDSLGTLQYKSSFPVYDSIAGSLFYLETRPDSGYNMIGIDRTPYLKHINFCQFIPGDSVPTCSSLPFNYSWQIPGKKNDTIYITTTTITHSNALDHKRYESFVRVLNTRGDSLAYLKLGSPSLSIRIGEAEQSINGNIYIEGGEYELGKKDPDGNRFIGYYSKSGNKIWKQYLQNDSIEPYEPYDLNLKSTADGGVYIVSTISKVQNDTIYEYIHKDGKHKGTYILLKYDSSGNFEWYSKLTNTDEHVYPFKIFEGEDQKVWVTGFSTTSDYKIRLFLSLIDSSHTVSWEKRIGPYFPKYSMGTYATIPAHNDPDIGKWYFFVSHNYQQLVFHFDTSGNIPYSTITGNVFHDIDSNCIYDSTENTFKGWTVIIKGPDYFTIQETDSAGNYELPAFTLGDYRIIAIPQGPTALWQACQDTITITVDSFYTTDTVNYGYGAVDYCPYLTVDAGVSRLRRCFDNTIYIKYQNLGTLPADSTYIEVALDPYLSVTATSIPPSAIDTTLNIYTFFIDTIDVFEQGQFTITAYVDCDSAILGQEHCIETHIYPDGFCQPDSSWDGASIQVSGECIGDSVLLKISNSGLQNMTAPLDFIVIEDEVIMLQGNFDLGSGEDTTVLFDLAEGFYRLEADQSPGHPMAPIAAVNVDGCGANPPTGFGGSFPQYGGAHFLDIICLPNTGAWDPNEKLASPQGYGAEHYIEHDWKIEYQVNFQNTGTDTAFTVVIRDTLSPFLQWDSLTMGVSSHVYDWQLDSNVLTITFNNINLPDSNINEPASHGFVTLSLYPRSDAPLGTVIENTAAIYFDFNVPIITNTVFHTLGEDFIPVEIEVFVPTLLPDATRIRTWPNPASHSATIEVHNTSQTFPALQLEIIDIYGRLLRRLQSDGNRFVLRKGDMAAGVYFFRIMDGAQLLGNGKVVFR